MSKKCEASMTMREFFAQFPTDESCLNHLFDVRFGQGHKCPACECEAKWYRIKAERAYVSGNSHVNSIENFGSTSKATSMALTFTSRKSI